jgi:hypothetical protein
MSSQGKPFKVPELLRNQIFGSPNKNRGKLFEEKVASLLADVTAFLPRLVEVRTQPPFVLHNKEEVRPDFELIYEQPPHRNHRIIECQSRNKSSNDIVHKIRQIKALSPSNRFIFVYEDPGFLSKSVRENLKSDGIVYYSHDEFAQFLLVLSASLIMTAPLVEANSAGRFSEFLQEHPVLKPLLHSNSFSKIEVPSKVRNKDEGMLSSPSNSYRKRW